MHEVTCHSKCDPLPALMIAVNLTSRVVALSQPIYNFVCPLNISYRSHKSAARQRRVCLYFWLGKWYNRFKTGQMKSSFIIPSRPVTLFDRPFSQTKVKVGGRRCKESQGDAFTLTENQIFAILIVLLCQLLDFCRSFYGDRLYFCLNAPHHIRLNALGQT